LEEILSEISDDEARSTAFRLLENGWTDELQELLRQQGILRADGTFNTEEYSIDWERPEEIEGEKIRIASLDTSFEYYNEVTAQRVGWEWRYVGSLDSVLQHLDSDPRPLTLGELVGLLDGTGLIDHFQESEGGEGYPHAWESDIYAELGEYYRSGYEEDEEADADNEEE
jgi:hypothetical protein